MPRCCASDAAWMRTISFPVRLPFVCGRCGLLSCGRPPVQSVRRPLRHPVASGSTNRYRGPHRRLRRGAVVQVTPGERAAGPQPVHGALEHQLAAGGARAEVDDVARDRDRRRLVLDHEDGVGRFDSPAGGDAVVGPTRAGCPQCWSQRSRSRSRTRWCARRTSSNAGSSTVPLRVLRQVDSAIRRVHARARSGDRSVVTQHENLMPIGRFSRSCRLSIQALRRLRDDRPAGRGRGSGAGCAPGQQMTAIPCSQRPGPGTRSRRGRSRVRDLPSTIRLTSRPSDC